MKKLPYNKYSCIKQLVKLENTIMYSQFCENFRLYLKFHSDDLSKNEYLLSLLEPFYGLCNYNTYENWKLSSDIRYYELSNLIYHLENDSPTFVGFEKFYSQLCELGYDSHQSDEFDKDKLEEQLKLLNILLGPKLAKINNSDKS